VQEPVREIVYFSTAAESQAEADIADVVAASYRHNVRDRITGLLVAGGHRYLQIVEGPPEPLEAMLGRIRRDRRHVGVTVLVDRHLPSRSFTSWPVVFDGEPDFGEFFTLGEMLRIMRAKVADRPLRAQIDCFTQLFVLNPLPPAPSPWTLAASYRERSALDRGH
jgi:hypothetical protein